MTIDDALDLTLIYSVANQIPADVPLIRSRPFRAGGWRSLSTSSFSISRTTYSTTPAGLGTTTPRATYGWGIATSHRSSSCRRLLNECDVHTLLRLPTGIFYAQGVKANVLFFDRKPASETPWTQTLWIYDLRTNSNFTLKTNQLARPDLDEFVLCYHPQNRFERASTWSPENPDGRWRSFTYDELMRRDKVNLDIFWLRDETLEDSANLPDPDVLAREIVEELEAALAQFAGISDELGGGEE